MISEWNGILDRSQYMAVMNISGIVFAAVMVTIISVLN
ncbi:hypothetical protein EcE24377A_2240 [Escherichia coli O139:H28 str. E24377A]|uniref:Uncharacterized protein n=1 Tax=Escherichia coli O139:H28 (strain E24377A / ETEC) TaxID=331111 RepID=A7ZNC7_ECO24|nr:hypothetical protein EcE24377A_2240 [Escherichia coli O139:H28 str. E24377A]